MRGIVAACVFALAVLLPGIAMAAEMMVNVQFYGRGNGNPAAAQQHTQGAAVSGDTTPYWNQFSVAGIWGWGGVGPGQILYLADDNSGLVASPVTFYQQSMEHNAIQMTALPIFKGNIYGHDGSSVTMEFSGLTTTELYDVYAYGAGAGCGPTKYTLTYGPGNSVAVLTTTDAQQSSYADPDNYVRFASVQPLSTGKLTIVGIATPGGNYFSVNGLQLVDVGPVPEPATLILLGTGLVGVLARRRRA